MRAESRSTQRGAVMAGSNRRRHYGIMLLLALGAALLSVALLHKLRERRVAGLFREQEQQLLALQLLLQKERKESRELRNRLEDLKAKTVSLINQKSELNNKLMEAETDITNLRRMRTEMEAALEEKQNQINREEEKAAESIAINLQVTTLAEQLKQKEAEIEEMKQHLHPKDSAPAEGSSSGNDTSLTSNKEENNQGGAETANPSDEKSSTEVVNSNEAANEEEQPSKEGKWVQLRTEVEDDDSKAENKRGENNGQESKASEGVRLEKVEISVEGESAGKQEEFGRESSSLLVAGEHEESPGHEEASDDTNGNGDARKEQEVAKEGEPEKPEQKEGGEGSEKNDQNKPKHRRGKKKKNKTRSRKQDAELREAAAAGDEQTTFPNAEDATTTDALTTTDGGSGNSTPTDERQHGDELGERGIETRGGAQMEDGNEGRRRDGDEQQEQEKKVASADEKSEWHQETQTDGSVLGETTASEADGIITETATMGATTSSARK